MSWFSTHRDPSAAGLAEGADGTWAGKVLGGLLAPAVLSWPGYLACVHQAAFIPGRNGTLELQGPAAVAFGIALLGVAAFLHFHYLWSPTRWLWALADLGKVLSLIAVVGGFGYVVWGVLGVG